MIILVFFSHAMNYHTFGFVDSEMRAIDGSRHLWSFQEYRSDCISGNQPVDI